MAKLDVMASPRPIYLQRTHFWSAHEFIVDPAPCCRRGRAGVNSWLLQACRTSLLASSCNECDSSKLLLRIGEGPLGSSTGRNERDGRGAG